MLSKKILMMKKKKLRSAYLFTCSVLLFSSFVCASKSNSPAVLKENISVWVKKNFSKWKKEAEKRHGLWLRSDGKWVRLKKVEAVQPVILLVHGLDDPGFLWEDLAISLEPHSKQVIRLSYPNDQSISRSSEFLFSQLKELKTLGAENVKIIAHSMGGLLVRDVMSNPLYYGDNFLNRRHLPNLNQVITIGTPNLGSSFANFQFLSEMGEQFFHLIRGESLFMGFYFDGFGEAAEDLLSGSEYLNKLNSRPMPESFPFTIIAGKISSGAQKK